MKNNVMIGLLSAAALLPLLGSCSDDFNPSGSGLGQINPQVDLDGAAIQSRSARAASAISVDDLSLKLTSSDGTFSKTWTSVSEFDTAEEFKVGTYTLEAYYGALETEGFDSPFYYGEAPVSVLENQVSSVLLTAKLANSMVSVEYTDAFKDYFTAYSMQLHSEGGAYINYAADETRPAYLRPGKVTILASVTKPNGTSATLEAASFDAAAQHHYTVTIDVNNGSAGDAQMVITFDDSLDQEAVIIDLSDELLNAPAPVASAEGFDPATVYQIVDGAGAEISPKINIIARGGISSVTMTTESRSLAEQGWPSEIDLVSATDAQKAKMQSLGLSALGLFGNVDMMAVIDLSGVLSNIRYRESGNNESSITVVVKDKVGKVSEPLTLSVSCEPVELSIANPSQLAPGQDNVDIELTYNGANVESNVKIEMQNERGTWSQTAINSITPLTRSSNVYRVNVSVPADDQDVVLRAVYGSSVSQQLKISRAIAAYSLSIEENNVYATYAIATVLDGGNNVVALPSTAKLLLSSDGVNFTEATASADGSTVKLTSLASGTEYFAKLEVDGLYSRSVSFTTEDASQLPNSGMETWCETDSGSFWELIYPGEGSNTSVWGTNNPMTTSQGSSYAYCRISGTISTDDGRTGKAALIRTVGWGSGNTAMGSKGSSGKTKYIDAGLLHIGSSREERPSGYSDVAGCLATDDLDCGLAFASRPSRLTFWYKYTEKNNSDYGIAEIYVYDSNGNAIASGSVNLNPVSAYSEVSIPLTYSLGAAKADKIYVKFLSTNDRSFLEKTDDNLSGPGFANLSRGTYMGSQLYVDDIELIY